MGKGYEQAIIEEIHMATKHEKALVFVVLQMDELTQKEHRAEKKWSEV